MFFTGQLRSQHIGILLIFNRIFVFLDAVGPSMIDDANNVTKADAGIFAVKLLIYE